MSINHYKKSENLRQKLFPDSSYVEMGSHDIVTFLLYNGRPLPHIIILPQEISRIVRSLNCKNECKFALNKVVFNSSDSTRLDSMSSFSTISRKTLKRN